MNVAFPSQAAIPAAAPALQADMKAMEARAVFATTVVTAVTAQNTQAVLDAFELPPDLIAKQIDAVYDDFTVGATKTGMLFSAAIIEVVAEKLQEREVSPLVVDPVMISKSGFSLLRDDAVETLRERLLPLATLVTPHALEARRLTGIKVDSKEGQEEAATAIHAMGPGAVLVKGGHVDETGDAVDVLYDGKRMHAFRAPRIATQNTHGTGCTYASAIAANMARGFLLRNPLHGPAICDRSHPARSGDRTGPRPRKPFLLSEAGGCLPFAE